MGDVRIGQLVYSKAGRDQNRPFLIWEITEDGYLGLVDGDLRKVENPKRKNIKHVRITHQVATEIAAKIMSGQCPSNAEVRRAIMVLSQPRE
ncbi:MAG: RNA-binding protein [Firmicutes bacterium]|nr:RNA-binding protein [Bacillota bacterium]